MSDLVTTTIRDGAAVVLIDHPPVNALNGSVAEGLLGAIDRAERDPDVRAIVIAGAGRTFIAGADINELERAAWDRTAPLPDLHPLMTRVEDCAKPVVIALHGTALGGGLEFAMAAHYRVAARDARMGQPEVNLGIIPGAEGTQRLPRLVGVQKAIDMCVTGKPIASADALQVGLVDRLIEGDLNDPQVLIGGAVAFAREVLATGGPHRKTRDRTEKLGTPEANAPLFAAGRELAHKTRRNMEAPLVAIDAIEAATSLPFADGCRKERQLSETIVRSQQARALIHGFFAERAVARVPGVSKTTRATPINTVAIVGSGTMGGGIAMASANAGLTVRLRDVSQELVDKGMATVRRNYESSIKRGRLTPEAVSQRLGAIHPQVGVEGFESVDLVIEAVFENMALKKQVFAELDGATKPDCVLATNTSTLDIDAIASATKRPESVIGLHFFSPASVMRLLEIVRGQATSPETIATALSFAKRLGKVGVVVRNAPGFVGNRIMFPYMYEAQFVAEDGATPEQVDRVLTKWGMAMGIFAVDDLGGLDVAWRVRQELGQFQEPGDRKPLVSEKLVAMGRLGQKTGKGWYRYEDGRTPIPDPEVVTIIEQVTGAAGMKRRAIGDEEVLERTIYALINEGARVLEEGVAARASDIDVVYLNGYGFPGYRGGPMFYADTVGLRTIFERVSAFHRELGKRWQPAPLLQRLATRGMTFRDYDAEQS